MEEEPTDAEAASINGRNELMEDEEPTDAVATSINGRNELMEDKEPTDAVGLSDATKNDGESSTQCSLCGTDYSRESLHRLLNPVQKPSYPFSRRHQQQSSDPLQESKAAVLKLRIDCQGCVAKIHQIVFVTEGEKEIVIDKQKETVAFKATLGMKKLNETLRRRPVMSAGRQIQNDNFIRYGKNTSLHLGSEIGHQQDSSASLKLRGTKPGAKEWAWVVMSLLFEGLSATFDQLGYTLTGMVMAYVALLFFVVELILKARKEEMLTWAVDRTSWLPLFRKRSAHNNSRNVMFLVSVVELFGLASAIWQCFQSTMQYMFNSHNPLKICLLPFLFVSCVIISKFIREGGQRGKE